MIRGIAKPDVGGYFDGHHPMNHLPLVLSALCCLLAFWATLAALKRRRPLPNRLTLAAMGAAFLLQTGFLLQRGHAIGHCPLTNLFEALIFLSWSITLYYLLLGPAYRYSPLGFFTEPLLMAIQAVALLAPLDLPPARPLPPMLWVETHAALAVMAYGAFAMAGVAGAMWLAQARQLKTHRLSPLFFQMPALEPLAVANRRLLWLGLALLSASLGAAAVSRLTVAPKVVLWGGTMWAAYLLILLARRIGPRRVALLSLSGFALAIGALVFLNHFRL
jgi:ABC-type transport system involved in cytochrome c biogenesis permease subunit